MEKEYYNSRIKDYYDSAMLVKIGRKDELVIPETVVTETKEWGAIFYPENARAIDTVVIFLHSGIRIPEDFVHLFTLTPEEKLIQLAQTITLNVDLGGGLIASELLRQLADNPTIAVVWYDYSRVVGDANRMYLEQQVPTLPYKGSSPWSPQASLLENRKVLVQQSLENFFVDVRQLITTLKPKLIISPHTYDETSGGLTTPGLLDAGSITSLRPAGMLFQHNTDPDPATDFTFLPPEKSELVKTALYQTLALLSTLDGKDIEVCIDFPYLVPMILPVWLKLQASADHLIFEIRKDAFYNCSPQDIQHIVTFLLESRNLIL